MKKIEMIFRGCPFCINVIANRRKIAPENHRLVYAPIMSVELACEREYETSSVIFNT